MPEPLLAPPDAAARLALIDAFATLSETTRAALAVEVEWLRVAGGERLFSEDDPADAAYFVIRGRFRVSHAGPDGEQLIGYRGAGEPVGEVGVLADVPRTATVQAVRDTDVVRVDRVTFDRLLRDDPATMVPLVSTVATRLADALRGRVPDAGRLSTLAILVDDGVEDAPWIVDTLMEELARRVPVVRLPVRGGQDGIPIPRLIAAIDEQEARGGFTILEVDPKSGPVAQRGLRQADAVVVIATPAPHRLAGPVLDALTDLRASGCTPVTTIVLLQPSWRAHPVGTAARVAGFDAHFHVSAGSRQHLARVARHLTGGGVGLVFGGGGARGLAHIGAYRALVEAGVPIDRVGGSSSGGVFAAQIAAGWSPDEVLARNRAEWPRARPGRRFTLPLLSLLSPEVAIRMLDRMFGRADLEDLWLPCFVTAVDLTECRLVVCRSGPVSRWTLATQSPPGIWPPVVGDDGALFVDGAVLDNLPVVPMRAEGAGRVVSVSVSRRLPFAAGENVRVTPSPVAFLRSLASGTVQRGEHFPNLLQVLNRTALVTGVAGHAVSQARSDVYVEPAVGEFALGDWSRVDDIVPRGYDAMRRALDEHADIVASWS